ncbi:MULTISPECIES: type II toxin-antitoxin system VapC family toxin [Methylobacterium]|uniref:type II toxin-antitoxin system VapC family toxin n=1 Tax=Methylobacterium TaxID=407 RepID=UPI0013EB2F3A|nr:MULTISPECIES: type II toxin-antitoxin system VapC family toxin [unclassified Methylobacterium]NGM38021.1 type II toxin-antitoxin system VapC family toxin [Methylobacterium sp. DB0501]
MTRFVLDASALLALLLEEPGADKVKDVLDQCVMTAVNLAEVVSHYAKLGAERHDIEALLRPLPIQLIPVDTMLSYDAGLLRSVTLEGGLSLGDRYCLALANREGVPALTAERRWPEIASVAGVRIELIR